MSGAYILVACNNIDFSLDSWRVSEPMLRQSRCLPNQPTIWWSIFVNEEQIYAYACDACVARAVCDPCAGMLGECGCMEIALNQPRPHIQPGAVERFSKYPTIKYNLIQCCQGHADMYRPQSQLDIYPYA